MGRAARSGACGNGAVPSARRRLRPLAVLATATFLATAGVAALGPGPADAVSASVSGGATGGWPAERGSAGSGHPALCVAPSRTDRLRARRSLLPVAASPDSVPAGAVTVTVTKAALVHGLARVLCRLPTSLPGAVACPMFIGPAYTLWFSTGRLTFPPVTVQTGGCEPVTGLGPTRWAIRTPELWRLIAEVFTTARVGPQPLDGALVAAATPSVRTAPGATPDARAAR